jgi:ectoine hydroxylase-related dioxygenase (phytanoyl-CoA dioxygenase family)
MTTIFSHDYRLSETFCQEGYVMIGLLSNTEVNSLMAAYCRLRVPGRPGFDATILSRDRTYRQSVDQAIRDLISPPVCALLTEYRVAFCSFVVKSANSIASRVPIHQDWSFVEESRFASLGLWCPLVDVDLHNGCLQVVRGSHKFSPAPRAACTPFAYPEIIPYLEAECLESIPMRAGQALLFDQRLFHCSPPNLSSSERIAATAVLVPHEAKLQYYHLVEPRDPNRIEVFEVEDDFYLSHIPGRRPENAVSLGYLGRADSGRVTASVSR